MKIKLIGTSAAAAIVRGVGLAMPVDAQGPAGSGPAPVETPAGAPQENGITVVTPEGRQQRPATVQRQQVVVGDGATVTVLRPGVARGEEAAGQEDDVQRERPLTWQAAAGGRLWLFNPATDDLRTCAISRTSTVGQKVLRCVHASWR